MDKKKKIISNSEKVNKEPTGNRDVIAEHIMRKYPDLAPNLRKNMQNTVKLSNDIGRQTLKVISEIIIPLSEIDWNKVNETWIATAENLGMNGWTIPLQIDLNEMIEMADLENVADMDKAFARFYSIEGNYQQMREKLLQNDLLNRWDPLLKQSFENYENGDYHIAIPSLFLILEGFAHHLLYQTYLETKPNKPKANLQSKFAVVRSAADKNSIEVAFYASAQFFINNAFQYANFENPDSARPLLINRNWVLHGRDDISQWKDIDALRLFNVISTLSILDFSS